MSDQFTCPSGGQWYACPSKKFVGCCAGGDPCSNGCAEGNLRPAAFNAAEYGKFPDASCGTNSKFYTCTAGATFWGCCESVACASDPPACLGGNMTAAYMDLPAQIDFYLGKKTAESKEGGSNGAVIGGAVGGAIGGLLIIGVIIFFFIRRRRQRQQTARGESAEAAKPMMDGGKAFDSHSPNFVAQSPPPTYSATNGDYYQSMTPAGKTNPYTQSPYSQGQWAHNADGPVEMEAGVGSSNRYSELPAEVERPTTHHRYSELSTGPSCRVSPQHSPQASQTENKIEPRPQGLGVVTEDANAR
ncbi:hypothetical protein E8E13_008423 [Curvularia kusanoi]|uniref:T cell CD4 receptor C-terminal region domain-containing protein n=1 Tax=Curvularia kusanoi TaxID=90978 RepID=A0A9P4WCA7_CURKU|nr:hypothetical protein E8E13_008423 [Curvularia kusanoi]